MLRRPASLAVDLAFLRGVDAAETDALGVMIAPDFERVAVEDPDHFGGGICRDSDAGKKDVKEQPRRGTWRHMLTGHAGLYEVGIFACIEVLNDYAESYKDD